jgi:hypothetical protein
MAHADVGGSRDYGRHLGSRPPARTLPDYLSRPRPPDDDLHDGWSVLACPAWIEHLGLRSAGRARPGSARPLTRATTQSRPYCLHQSATLNPRNPGQHGRPHGEAVPGSRPQPDGAWLRGSPSRGSRRHRPTRGGVTTTGWPCRGDRIRSRGAVWPGRAPWNVGPGTYRNCYGSLTCC